jgi:tetratricopeptide (TPR) repeat protein
MNNTLPKTALSRAIILLAILGLIVGGFIYQQQQEKRQALEYSPAEIEQLDESKRKEVLETQLQDLEQKARKLTSDATISDKFVVYIQLAEVRTALGKFAEAINALDQVREERSGNSRLWTEYAKAYRGLGDSGKAKESIQQALNVDDELPLTWQLYLEINSDLPDQQLDALYVTALQKTKNDLDLVISYAKFLEKIGNIERAVAYWETARNVDPARSADYEKEISRLRPTQ